MHELDIRAGRQRRAATLEQLIRNVGADDGPIGMTARDRLCERGVAATGIEDSQSAVARVVLERFDGERKSQPARRRKLTTHERV